MYRECHGCGKLKHTSNKFKTYFCAACRKLNRGFRKKEQLFTIVYTTHARRLSTVGTFKWEVKAEVKADDHKTVLFLFMNNPEFRDLDYFVLCIVEAPINKVHHYTHPLVKERA